MPKILTVYSCGKCTKKCAWSKKYDGCIAYDNTVSILLEPFKFSDQRKEESISQ